MLLSTFNLYPYFKIYCTLHYTLILVKSLSIFSELYLFLAYFITFLYFFQHNKQISADLPDKLHKFNIYFKQNRIKTFIDLHNIVILLSILTNGIFYQ